MRLILESPHHQERIPMTRVLVAYATKSGSAQGVAERIGETLTEQGAEVEVRSVKERLDVTSYDAVVLGSAIRMGKWLKGATSFAEKNREALSKIPTAYFLVCLTLAKEPEKLDEVAAYLDPVRESIPEIKPVGVGLFAGGFYPNKLSLLPRTILSKMGSVEGDHSDPEAIKAWAEEIAPKLSI